MSTAPSDAPARARALDPSVSCIVQAPAGSGKTGLLIQRYLMLLARVNRPEEVLAITFTRKATTEMRGRVLDALALAAQPSPRLDGDYERRTFELAGAVLERDRELGWQLGDAPSRLRVLTIDALCLSLARQMPTSCTGGVPGRVLEDATELYRRTARELLDGLASAEAWSEALVTVLAHLDNELGRFEQMLVQMLVRRDQWMTFLGRGAGDRERFERGLARAVSDALRALRSQVPPELELELAEVCAAAAGRLQASAPDALGVPCAAMTELPGHAPEDLTTWQAAAALTLTEAGAWRARLPGVAGDRALGERASALLAALRGRETLRLALHAVRRLPAPAYTDSQWRVLSALLEVLRVAAGLLQVIFAETGRIDFVELGVAARRSLGTDEAPTDLAFALDYRIGHILVDEFQDTSHAQVALLEALTAGWSSGDGRTVFLVGDPMQSIYRFREADVGLFLHAWRNSLPAVELEPIRLQSNFRAGRALVEWVNEVLPRALAPHDDAAAGAVSHRRAVAARRSDSAAAVALHVIENGDRDLEARCVVEQILATRSHNPDERIAVLVRTRTHLERILPAFDAAGIAVRGVDVEPLAAVPPVQDLLALTRALLHPADRIAWFASMRGPWCGLTLNDLYHLAGDDHDAPIPQLLDDPQRLARLDADARRRCERWWRALSAARASQGRVALRAWVEGTWLALGGPACAAPGPIEKASAYFELLDELEAEGGPLDPDLIANRVNARFAPAGERADAVDVMTIHKAKGLEFDTVIVPGLERVPRAEERQLLAWTRSAGAGGGDLLLAPIPDPAERAPPLYRFVRDLDATKARHERGRLLYVATTRARRRLHLVAGVRRSARGTGLAKPPADSLLGALWPALAPAFERALARVTSAPSDTPALRADACGEFSLRRLPAGWAPPSPPPALAWTRRSTGAELAGGVAVEFQWAGELARHVGTVVHRTLRDIATQGVERWDSDRVGRSRASWRSALRSLGVANADLDRLLGHVEQAIGLTLTDERGRWLLDRDHREAGSEVELSGRLDGRLVRIVIDRTFVDARGIRWIIDYKSGRHEGGDPDAFLDREQARYRAQLERYAALVASEEDRPIRLGLYYPMLPGWREWAFDSSPEFG